MPTTADLVNALREKKAPSCPVVSRLFAGKTALDRISNSRQGRSYSNWNDSNPGEGRAIIRLASWMGYLTEHHLHHVTSVAHGGSFNFRNILITPPQLNSLIKEDSWSIQKINSFVNGLSEKDRKDLEIPEWWKAEALTNQFKTYNRNLFNPVGDELGRSEYPVTSLRKVYTTRILSV